MFIQEMVIKHVTNHTEHKATYMHIVEQSLLELYQCNKSNTTQLDFALSNLDVELNKHIKPQKSPSIKGDPTKRFSLLTKTVKFQHSEYDSNSSKTIDQSVGSTKWHKYKTSPISSKIGRSIISQN
jgi:hypothetical protein